MGSESPRSNIDGNYSTIKTTGFTIATRLYLRSIIITHVSMEPSGAHMIRIDRAHHAFTPSMRATTW